MFIIQYQAQNGEAKMQSLDSNDRRKLVKHLSSFEQPILAVFEQATPITKAVRNEMANQPHNRMTRAALSFIGSRAP